MNTKLKVERLNELLQSKDFKKRRSDAYRVCHGKWDFRQIAPQQYAAFIQDELQTQFFTGLHDDLFLELVLADLTGFGPIGFLSNCDGLLGATLGSSFSA